MSINWKNHAAAAATLLTVSGHPNSVDAKPKVNPAITSISDDVHEKKHGMDLAQRIIDRRKKSPAEFKKGTSIVNPYANWKVEEFDADICKGEGECKRSPENAKIDKLYRDAQELIRKGNDPLALMGMVLKKGEKRLFAEAENADGMGGGAVILFGNEAMTSTAFNGEAVSELAPEERKRRYEKMTAFLHGVKRRLEQPVKDAPRFVVVKETPETVKNLGANSHRGPRKEGGRDGIIPANTLVKVIRTDAESGYCYIEGGGFIHESLLDPFDAKTFHPESFGAKEVQVRDSDEVRKNGGLNLRDEKGQVIGKVPVKETLHLLAVEMHGLGDDRALRVLVQYRDKKSGKLMTGYLISAEFSVRARIYLDGIK